MFVFVYSPHHLKVIFSASGSHSNNTRDTQEHLAFFNTNLQIVLNTQNRSLLKSSHPNKYLPNFPTPKKFLESKMSNPQKILQSSLSLEIQSIPPAPLGWYAKECTATSNCGWTQPDSTTSNTSTVP